MTRSRALPTRILLTTDSVGGVWNYTLTLAAGFVERGSHCVIAVIGPEVDDSKRSAAAVVPNCRLIETDLPLDWTASDYETFAASIATLHDITRANGADTVHLHAPALAIVPWSTPAVAVAHSCVGTWWEALRAGPLPGDLAWRKQATAEGLAAADAIIAPSSAFAQALQRVYQLEREIHVVYNGVGFRSIPAVERQAMVLTAGRLWDEAKNVATLDAAAELLSAPIHAAGSVRGPNTGTYVPRHLKWLGDLTSDEMRTRLASAALFASPARYEPFGLAVLEAAQVGTPLVLADIPTFRELWDGAAVFVAPTDAAAWTRTLQELLHDADQRLELGRRAIERARSFTAAAMVDATAAIHHAVHRRALQTA